MSYTVSQLLEEAFEPVVATPDESIHEALDRMLSSGFSQLPVVKGDEFYFITHESILSALHSFGSRVQDSGLRVDDALVRVPNVYRMGDDLFDLLAGMREMNAALIVDDNRNLTHVVTSYDTTRYFRQWAEDIMQVRDVEHSLRRIITNAFKKVNGEIDEVARQNAVDEISPSNRLRRKFKASMGYYLQKIDAFVAIDDTLLTEAFKILLDKNESVRQFSELALGEYIQLFFKDTCWPRCQEAIQVRQEDVQYMLDGVRETRNDLAHFREEQITAQKRLQLKMCADWLTKREKTITAALEATAPGQ